MVYKLGNICHLVWRIAQETNNYWTLPKKLDADIRPARKIFCPCAVIDYEGYAKNICGMLYIGATDGSVGIQVAASSAKTVNTGSVTWIING